MGAVLLAAILTADKPVVAVLYFDNATAKPEFDLVRKGLADMLVTDLVAWDGVTVVERTRLEDVLSELKLQQSKAFDPKTAVRVGKLMGAQFQLTGTLNLSGRTLVVDAKLLKTQDGTVALAARAEADQDKVFELEQDLATKIIAAIDSKLQPDPVARRKARVPDLATLLSYSKAIDLSDQGKLSEAQAEMQRVVSKAPSFLLARERREQLLARFQEYELKKKDLISDSALELGRRIEAALADEGKLDSMDAKAAAEFLSMRLLKGRLILRAAKKFFSSREPSLRVALRGQEAQALLAMKAWLENARRFSAELRRTQLRFPNLTQAVVPADVLQRVQEAQFGTLEFHDPSQSLEAFVLYGRADDGAPFTLAPALGFIEDKERAAVLADLDRQVDAAFAEAKTDPKQSWKLTALIRRRNDASLQLYDVDAAVSLLQRFLDAFPTSSEATRCESDIKLYLSGRGLPGSDHVEKWNKGLKTCDGMSLNVGSQSVRERIHRAGIAGVFAMASEMEKACPRTPQLDSTFSTIYSRWAGSLAAAEDCEGHRLLFAKYLAAGGSVRDMVAHERRSGCSLAELKKSVSWFHSRRDQNWDAEFNEELGSSFDGKTLHLTGRSWLGTPNGKRRQGLDLKAERQPDGAFKCVWAQSLRYDGARIDGTCSLEVSSLAPAPGQFDEGTFSATFLEPWDGHTRKSELTEGQFRLKRK